MELFAGLAESGKWKEQRENHRNRRKPIPKPGMQTANVPIGPVLVTGACNFLFAISVVGTDTASALAVGCPVVVKAHPDHARTCQSLADLVEKSLRETGMPTKLSTCSRDGTLGHPGIGRASKNFMRRIHRFTREEKPSANWPTLRDLPFHAEMGSLNPVFVLPHALEKKGKDLAKAFVTAANLFSDRCALKPGLGPD